MRYATTYDVGDTKRPSGVNEDSVAMAVFEQGHRNGYRDRTRAVDVGEDGVEMPATRSVGTFALADGAGGEDAGDVASYIASTVICEDLAGTAVRAARTRPGAFDVTVTESAEPPSPEELRGAVADAIERAHRAIISEAAASGVGAYTTVVAGIVAGGALHVGWVGDSRAYVVNRESGDIARLTKDHAVVERLHDQGDIDDVEAHVHPRANEITRALGGTGGADPERATVEVDTRSVPLYAEDVVLVTSDGLLDAQVDTPDLYDAYIKTDRSEDVATRIRERVVTDDELRDVILEAESLEAAAARFVNLANDRGGRDNVSTLLFRDRSLDTTPDDVTPGLRDVDADIEDRETVIVDDD